MRKLTLFIAAMLISMSVWSKWSEYPACSKQYDEDIAACNKMKTTDNAKKQSCWASANERLAQCSRYKGKKLDFPALLNK